TPAGGPPTSVDNATIPTSPTGSNFPVLITGDSFSVKNLTLGTGAQVTQNGGTLTVLGGDLTINSTATYAQNGGTLNLDKNFANSGNFTASAGTVVFTG